MNRDRKRFIATHIHPKEIQRRVVHALSEKVHVARVKYQASEKQFVTLQLLAQMEYMSVLVQYFDARERMDADTRLPERKLSS